nr:hypothetical protein OH820_01220 [Streptomyces sp. NBC_00857]
MRSSAGAWSGCRRGVGGLSAHAVGVARMTYGYDADRHGGDAAPRRYW